MAATVLTTWFTTVPDPNGGDVCRTGGSEVLAELRASLRAHGAHLTVFHDCLDDADDEHTAFVRVEPQHPNPYLARWHALQDWAVGHPRDRAWMVDGTDVVMLNDPTPEYGTLYIGSEEVTLAAGTMEGDWMRGNHLEWAHWLDNNAECRLLNPGIIGGAGVDLFSFADDLLEMALDSDKTDMAAANWAARAWVLGPVVTGPAVHSPFRAMKRDGAHWWAHK